MAQALLPCQLRQTLPAWLSKALNVAHYEVSPYQRFWCLDVMGLSPTQPVNHSGTDKGLQRDYKSMAL